MSGYEHVEAIYLIPIVAGIIVLLYIIGSNRIIKLIYRFRHPLTKYVLSSTKPKRNKLYYLNIILSIIIASTILFSIALPYTTTYKYVKTTQTLEATISLKRKIPVVILLDSSGSMRGEKIETAIKAVKLFIDKTIDYVLIGLIVFSDHIKLSVPPTSDLSLLYNTLSEVRAYGGTIYSKPLRMAYKWLIPYTEFNLSSTIIFVTDGLPFPEDIPLYRQVVYECAKKDIVIDTIFIETPVLNSYEQLVAKQRLLEIANITHGGFYTVKQIDKLVDLFNKLAEETITRAGNYILTSHINYLVTIKTYTIEKYVLLALSLALLSVLLRVLIYRSTL